MFLYWYVAEESGLLLTGVGRGRGIFRDPKVYRLKQHAWNSEFWKAELLSLLSFLWLQFLFYSGMITLMLAKVLMTRQCCFMFPHVVTTNFCLVSLHSWCHKLITQKSSMLDLEELSSSCMSFHYVSIHQKYRDWTFKLLCSYLAMLKFPPLPQPYY